MEEAKKMKCYKRLIYKQFFQVSGLCACRRRRRRRRRRRHKHHHHHHHHHLVSYPSRIVLIFRASKQEKSRVYVAQF